MLPRIAVIGTREPGLYQITLCESIVQILVDYQFEVATGAADGIDSIAMKHATSKCHVYLPWPNYNPQYIKAYTPASVTVYDENLHKDWAESVRKLHPKGNNLTQGAFKLHSRNYGIISPCAGVIAFPSTGGGGTAQGMRIARSLKIPLAVFYETPKRPAEIQKALASKFLDEVSTTILQPILNKRKVR